MTTLDSSGGACSQYTLRVDDGPGIPCRVCEQPASAHAPTLQGGRLRDIPFAVVCGEAELVELRGKRALVEIAQDVLREGGAA